MIGAGTGVAPFRGFLQELNQSVSAGSTGQQQREAMLFFGCRNENDYLYRSELEESASSASIELHVAFSRPKLSKQDSKKYYVQDLLWEHRNRVWELLQVGAHIYVCGDGRHMAKDVDAKLCSIAVDCGGMNEDDAIALLERLQKKDKYLQDV